jgi:metallophosphoesterase superfamily enzyme
MQELTTLFSTIALFEKFILIAEGDAKEKAKSALQDVKREARRISKQESNTRIITGDYDGYTEKITLDDTITTAEEAEAFFIDHYKRTYTPSQYDCTGQAFTIWHKIAYQAGYFVIYHHVGFDV